MDKITLLYRCQFSLIHKFNKIFPKTSWHLRITNTEKKALGEMGEVLPAKNTLPRGWGGPGGGHPGECWEYREILLPTVTQQANVTEGNLSTNRANNLSIPVTSKTAKFQNLTAPWADKPLGPKDSGIVLKYMKRSSLLQSQKFQASSGKNVWPHILLPGVGREPHTAGCTLIQTLREEHGEL